MSHKSTTIALILAASSLIACTAESTAEKSVESTANSEDSLKSDAKCKPKKAKDHKLHNMKPFLNENGLHATYSITNEPFLDTENPFFQSLGTNGRACVTCHAPENSWSFSAASAQERFDDSCGTDPLFRTNDGSTNPNDDVSTLAAKREAYKLLLDKGLIRIELKIPANAQFELLSAVDPYNNDTAGKTKISVFRRPTQATNLKFANGIMWDMREPNLASQAQNATLGHAQGTPLSQATLDSIVAFETSIFTSQIVAWNVGFTAADGAKGDPFTLSTETFVPNSNRPAPPAVFNIYAAWADSESEHRQSVVRGQALFNTRTGVDPFVPPGIPNVGTCTTCHNSNNTGGFTGLANSAPAFGAFANARISTTEFSTPDLPMYTFRNKLTGAILQSSDPGKAMTTGLIRDWNRFRTPVMRGLSGRAPYFHNGQARNLREVVEHYNQIISFNFTDAEITDVVNFLETL